LRRRHEQVGLRLRVLRNELLDVMGEQEVRNTSGLLIALVTCDAHS
jgi:hypothetical protein